METPALPPTPPYLPMSLHKNLPQVTERYAYLALNTKGSLGLGNGWIIRKHFWAAMLLLLWIIASFIIIYHFYILLFLIVVYYNYIIVNRIINNNCDKRTFY